MRRVLVVARGLLVAACGLLVVACKLIVVACTCDLVPGPGIELKPPALGAWILNPLDHQESPISGL